MTNIDSYDRVRVFPYMPKSASARRLAEELGGKRILRKGSKYVPKQGDLVINWGSGDGFPQDSGATVLNGNPERQKTVTNKLTFFKDMQGEDWLPEFWTDQEEVPDEAFPIVCRTKLTGHSGQGIVISASRDDLVPADLYVRYIPKKDEYRVHIGTYRDEQGNVEYALIDLQQKKRKKSHDDPNWQIRNKTNGFVYAREGVDPPLGVVESAVACFAASGLDFGAVDVIWNDHYGKAYILEINTAPGLEGTTLKRYADYFNGRAPGLQMLGV